MISEPSFAIGEAAFREGDYETAIAHLEAVTTVELDDRTRQNAFKVLLVAYTKADRLKDAIAVCQRLTQTPEEYPWAPKILADLTKRYRQTQAAEFVPPSEQRPGKKPSTSGRLGQDFKPQLPTTYQKAPQGAPTVFIPDRQWRNAERAKTWQPLKKQRKWPFWAWQGLSALLFIWFIPATISWSMYTVNQLLISLPFLNPIALLQFNPSKIIFILIFVIAIASPWLLDFIFKSCYHLEPLPLYKIASQHPETAKVFQRLTRQYQLPTPQLGLIPTGAPLILTYGHHRRTVRIILSDTLLEQLEDEELATIIAAQFSHFVQKDILLFSGAITLLQIPFILYWQTAIWGEKLSLKTPQILAPIIQGVSGILAALFYGFYWLWRLPLLPISRARQYQSDRFAAEFTGNPNALSRGLLKMAIGLAKHIEKQQQTSELIESCELLIPINHRQAISLGSLPDKTPFEEVLRWDCTNPYRHWLNIINSHPLIGDRLYQLNRYANIWRLPPEIELPIIVPPARTFKQRLIKLKKSYTALPILQSAILSGLIFGFTLRALLWAIGILSDWSSNWVRLPLWRLIWFYNAQPLLINACLCIAFSISLIIWINGYFPDVRITPTRKEPRIQDLISKPESVPPKSYPIRLTGQLLGRKGIRNWLGQDLILKTSAGSIKLHFFSKLGPIGNLLPIPPRPEALIKQEVTVLGWLRRGSTPWIDVDIIETKGGKKTRSGYPVWVTGLAIISAILGAYLIWQA